jgi:hypothetical protein
LQISKNHVRKMFRVKKVEKPTKRLARITFNLKKVHNTHISPLLKTYID